LAGRQQASLDVGQDSYPSEVYRLVDGSLNFCSAAGAAEQLRDRICTCNRGFSAQLDVFADGE